MYIAPTTNIRLLHQVPLDNTYDHTIFFYTAAAQQAYFAGLTKYNLANYTYQRVQKAVSRVGINAENLYDCNYMMFQNTGFGNKWFYAFITSVEYVNNECSEIRFELDEIQTWHFDYSPDICFVERQHSGTDNIGDNILPEPVALGEYVFNGSHPIIDFSDLSVIVGIVNVNTETGTVQGNKYDGIYGAATLYSHRIDGILSVDTLNTLLQPYIQKPEAIICLYVCPTAFIGDRDTSTGRLLYFDRAKQWEIADNTLSPSWSLDGYVPKNKKLFTYPYNYYMADNGMGDTLILPYEYFSNLTPRFYIAATVTQPVKAVLRPHIYKNINACLTENLTLSDFPMCSWAFDAYAAWQAQNTIPNILTGIKAVGSGVASTLGGQPQRGAEDILGMAMDMISKHYTASIQADITRGNFSNGNVNVSDKKHQFYGSRMTVKYQYAKMIDDFFSRFGYATNNLTLVNRSSRPHWNYTKTVGCTLTGSVPADSMKKLCQIYDHGITWWKSGAEVGNYTLNNSPS